MPGWAAPVGLYRLPAGWEPIEPPAFRATRGELLAYRGWLVAELERRRAPLALAGHSMGGALAILAAADRPELIEKLILLSPAGLPLRKRMRASVVTFAGQIARGCYPATELVRATATVLAAPLSAVRLARTVHALDLAPELERVRSHGIRCTVIGCATDELTPPAHCRRMAELLDADYREVDRPEGHIWMISEPGALAGALRP